MAWTSLVCFCLTCCATSVHAIFFLFHLLNRSYDGILLVCFFRTGWTPTLETPWSACRPREITQWISAQNSKVDRGELDDDHRVQAWVAIDDRPLLHESGGKALEGHFVQTNVRRGLTRAMVDSVVACLRDVPADASSAPASPSSPTLGKQAAAAFTATAPASREKAERAQPQRSTFPYSATASRALTRSGSSEARLAGELTTLRISSPPTPTSMRRRSGTTRGHEQSATNTTSTPSRLRWDQFALA